MLLGPLAATGAGHAAEAPRAASAPFAAEAAPVSRAAPAGAAFGAAAELIRSPVFSTAGSIDVKGRAIALDGVSAPNLDLRCGSGADAWPCGKTARTALQRFVRGRTVACEAASPGAARCSVAGRDIGEWLVSQGWAAAGHDRFREAEKAARNEQRGMWSPVRAALFQTLGPGAAAGLKDAVLRAEVELSTQSMTVTYRGEVIGQWPVSTAREGKETPTGAWMAQWLSRDHRSKLYDDAPMPYAIFYEGDYAIHGTYQTKRLGRPASHGCVRLSPQNAKRLFGLAEKEGLNNTLIVIRP